MGVDACKPAEHRDWTPTQVAFWLGTRRVIPSAKEIKHHVGCSRATAYRWHAFAASAGQTPLPNYHAARLGTTHAPSGTGSRC